MVLSGEALDALSCADCKRLLGRQGDYYACQHGWHGKLWPADVLLMGVSRFLPVELPDNPERNPRDCSREVNNLLSLARHQGRS